MCVCSACTHGGNGGLAHADEQLELLPAEKLQAIAAADSVEPALKRCELPGD